MDTPRWVTDAVFYEIFPDRFARSNRLLKQGLNLEPWDSPPTVHGFKGGDLYGIVEHLDYLQDLGINALYLTPVFASASNHRYHTYDYFRVDPLLGGNEALRELLDSAHARSMRVILDGVFNHASRGFWQFHHTLENGWASPYVDWFHFDPDRLSGRRPWGVYPSPEEEPVIKQKGSLQAIGYQAWWDLPALPKFNIQNPSVREFLFGVAEHWIRFGIDGWRLDVPGDIDDDSFWREFRRRVRAVNPEAYLVGELWHDARRWLQGDQFDASMNYQLAAACLSFFAGPRLNLPETLRAVGYQGYVQPIDAVGFAERIDSMLGAYAADVRRVEFNLLDSHDTPRFITCASSDADSWKLALLFLLTFPGTPCLFYGDEIGVAGTQDPGCRQPFPWNADTWNRDLRGFTQKLIALRLQHKALRWGNFGRLYAEGGVYAFQRAIEGEAIVVALNTVETAQSIEVAPQGIDAGQPRALAGEAEIGFGQKLRLGLPPRAGAVISFPGH